MRFEEIRPDLSALSGEYLLSRFVRERRWEKSRGIPSFRRSRERELQSAAKRGRMSNPREESLVGKKSNGALCFSPREVNYQRKRAYSEDAATERSACRAFAWIAGRISVIEEPPSYREIFQEGSLIAVFSIPANHALML